MNKWIIMLVACLLVAGGLTMGFFDRLFGKKDGGGPGPADHGRIMGHEAPPVPASQPHGAGAFRLAEGCEVADLTGIHEGFSVAPDSRGFQVFTVNVSNDRLPEVFLRLTELPVEPFFFTIEMGTHEDEEAKLRKNQTDPFHKDVYYLDGLSRTAAHAIFDKYRHLLTNDGGVTFGLGSHGKNDEVFVGPYKIVYIYAVEPEKYRHALLDLGFKKGPKIKTVWDNFGPHSPGKRNVLTKEQKTIWDMVKELKSQGLYLAERRED